MSKTALTELSELLMKAGESFIEFKLKPGYEHLEENPLIQCWLSTAAKMTEERLRSSYAKNKLRGEILNEKDIYNDNG